MKRHLLKTVVFFGILAIAAQAQALAIMPGDAFLSGPETSQAAIDFVFVGDISPSVLLYKQDEGGSESGPLAGSYNTTFNADLSGGTIAYTGGDIVGPVAFLLVKDGNHDPGWYAFSLSPPVGPDWNGMETLVLSGFWPGPGSISHVSLYGSRAVPEPGTLFLLGSGLVSLTFARRKIKA